METTPSTSRTATRTFCVPADNLHELEKQVARIARKAARMGMAPVTLERVAEAQRKRIRPSGAPEIIDLVVVEASGPAPKIPGWTFGGTLQHLTAEDGERINLLRTLVEGVPEEYRSANPWCCHCNVDRRWRDTYLVRHDESGAWKQVGRACIADFLGHPDAAALAEVAQWLRDLEVAEQDDGDGDEGFGGGGGRGSYPLRDFLAFCFDVIAVEGWTSRGQARESCGARRATAELALDLVDPPQRQRYAPPSPEGTEKASVALAWALDLDPAGDFEWNIQAIARVARVTYKTAGIAAAIAVAHERALSRALEQRRKATVSEHFGQVGKRATYLLAVERRHSYDTAFGVKTAVVLVDERGNMAVWKTAGVPDLEPGRVYTVKATVKEHGEWGREGQPKVKQTVLARLAVQHDHGVGPPAGDRQEQVS